MIAHAASNCTGTGTGIRSLPSQKTQTRVGYAIEKVWREAYGWPMSERDKGQLCFGEIFIREPEEK